MSLMRKANIWLIYLNQRVRGSQVVFSVTASKPGARASAGGLMRAAGCAGPRCVRLNTAKAPRRGGGGRIRSELLKKRLFSFTEAEFERCTFTLLTPSSTSEHAAQQLHSEGFNVSFSTPQDGAAVHGREKTGKEG